MNGLTATNATQIQNHSAAGMGELLERFANYIQVRDTTAQSYGVCLRCFAEWLTENGVTKPQRADILSYVKWLSSPHPSRKQTNKTTENEPVMIQMAAGTQARYLQAVKVFFKWTAKEGLYPNIADNIKGAKVRADNKKRDALQKDDVQRVLASIDTTEETGKRDYAMILLSITGGLRIIEMQRANIGDMETIAGERVLFIQGKGRDEKDAYKKIPAEVYQAIRDYLDTRSTAAPSAPLFAGVGNRSRGQRLTEQGISHIIKDRLKDAGYDSHRLSAHSLRHTSVTSLLSAGATLQEAQEHARHASPQTTGIYAHNLSREKDHSEQRIYDFLFDVEVDAPTQAANLVRRMNADQQKRALELLRAIAG